MNTFQIADKRVSVSNGVTQVHFNLAGYGWMRFTNEDSAMQVGDTLEIDSDLFDVMVFLSLGHSTRTPF